MRVSSRQIVFDRWLKDHQGIIFKVLRVYAPSPHDREDLFQEIVTQIWRSVPRFKGESKDSTWIYRISLYAAMAWSKKERRHDEKKEKWANTSEVAIRERPISNPRIDWLYEQIGQMSEVDRSLTLLMLDGFSYREIAELLGLSQSNVGVKFNRIKKRLTEQSKEEFENAI